MAWAPLCKIPSYPCPPCTWARYNPRVANGSPTAAGFKFLNQSQTTTSSPVLNCKLDSVDDDFSFLEQNGESQTKERKTEVALVAFIPLRLILIDKLTKCTYYWDRKKGYHFYLQFSITYYAISSKVLYKKPQTTTTTSKFIRVNFR